MRLGKSSKGVLHYLVRSSITFGVYSFDLLNQKEKGSEMEKKISFHLEGETTSVKDSVALQSTPLLAATRDGRTAAAGTTSTSEASFRSAKSSSVSSTSSTGSRGWSFLQARLEHGDFLATVGNASSYITPDNGNDSGSVYSKKGEIRRSKSIVRREVFQEIQRGTNISLRQCIIFTSLYMVISIIIFSYVLEPQWTVIDSAYFALSTFTTLGYGDLSPTHAWSKVFTCLYGLLGVACFGLALGQVGNRLLDDEEQASRRAQQISKVQVMTLFSDRGTSENDPSAAIMSAMGSHPQFAAVGATTVTGAASTGTTRNKWEESEKRKRLWRTIKIIFFVSQMIILAAVIGWMADWTTLETTYYLIISGCTIGYGDYTPVTQEEKFVALFFIPVAVVVTGHGLSYIANWIMEENSSRFRSRYEERELTQEDLDAMDVNGDGVVTRAEFLEFMLVAMNKIDWDLVDELQTFFNHLDAAGTGQLSREDLVTAARRKLKSPRRKLELAAYKQHLIKQSSLRKQQQEPPPQQEGTTEGDDDFDNSLSAIEEAM